MTAQRQYMGTALICATTLKLSALQYLLEAYDRLLLLKVAQPNIEFRNLGVIYAQMRSQGRYVPLPVIVIDDLAIQQYAVEQLQIILANMIAERNPRHVPNIQAFRILGTLDDEQSMV